MMKKMCIIAVLAAAALCFGIITAGKGSEGSIISVSDITGSYSTTTVILDAGHGGEDSGAVSADGTFEKDLNLFITENIAAYFELFGIAYIPVRTSDISVCDKGLQTVRERKRSDISNRYSLINSTPGAVLLSIHQNMFSDSKYSGTQVFYAADIPSSQVLAEQIQRTVCALLQPDNTRKIKPCGDSVYLLYRAKTTSVMVECGFISNEKELSMLKTPEYRAQIGYCVYKGFMSYIKTEGAGNGAKS